jgi:hypothetical protein
LCSLFAALSLKTELQFATRIDGISLAEWSGKLAYGNAQWRDIGR